MAAPQRKQPDRRRKPAPPPPPPIALRMAGALGRALVWPIVSNPRVAAGLGVLAVIYSFVGANALWYQHGNHPSPWFATRSHASDPAADVPHDALAATDATPVTTFRIEREADQSADAAPADAATAKPDPLVAEIQKQLAARDLYVGPTDGLMGPRTIAAIQFFEETEGLTPTGEPSVDVLKRLKRKPGNQMVAVPGERYGDQTGSVKKPVEKTAKVDAKTDAKPPANQDDVASLILAADPVPGKIKPDPFVKTIQQGLRNASYQTVEPDGILGAVTREAIRNFQKHYNLPIDGEPSQAVLKRLKSIGAL